MSKGEREMDEWPIIHDERSHARDVRFADKHAMIHLADSRIMAVPLWWFPPIKRASNQQRMNYTTYDSGVYWREVDDGIDLTAMLTGMYIVPIYQRQSHPKPHIPTTRLFLDGGTRQSGGGMSGVPFVHDTRNIPEAIRFTKDHIMFDLADGRILGWPSRFCPSLASASDSERQDFVRRDLTLRWEKVDVEINLIAVLTGFYDLDTSRSQGAIEPAKAATT